jgi:hypothetical protein
MKIGTKLSLVFAAAGSLALALPAQAQHRGSNGGSSRPTGGSAPVSAGQGSGSNVSPGNRGGTFHGGNQGAQGFRDHDGHFHRWHDHVNVFFGGGFGYPFYGYPYGYPYYGYPGYGYGYGYGYAPYYGYGYGYPAVAPGYTYDPRGIYDGRVVNGGQRRLSLEAQVQQGLSEAGFYHGAIDGVVGEGTRRAIRSYERANGLRVDGRIDNQLLATMGLG